MSSSDGVSPASSADCDERPGCGTLSWWKETAYRCCGVPGWERHRGVSRVEWRAGTVGNDRKQSKLGVRQ